MSGDGAIRGTAGGDAAVEAPPSPIHAQSAPRTPLAEIAALVDALCARLPALRGLDPRLREMIMPIDDLVAEMRFVPGEGPVTARVGRWINAELRLPGDGRPWTVGYRSERHTEPDDAGAPVDFLFWEVVNDVGARADREEQVHLYSVVRLADGSDRLAVSRRRLSNTDPRELPGKARDRYTISTARVTDHRADAQLVRFLARSAALRAVVGDAGDEALQIVRTDMDRPFQMPLLLQIGARSHNYYVLNRASGARMFVHFFDFWHGEKTRLVDRVGRVFMPHEVGHYEVTGFRTAARAPRFDPSLDTGLKSEFPSPRLTSG